MIKLQEFVGNRQTRELLRRKSPPPASLFAGPAGVGKKTLALTLAALANCRSPEGEDICLRCASCIKTLEGNHPDIRLIQPEKNVLEVETMRKFNREAQYRPFEGRLRFFIIEPAEKMSEAAANCILKTLEEPPETSRIVLITAFPNRLLTTIRSRCQLFSFHPLEQKTLEEYLRERFERKEAEARAAFSGGSIGAALALDLKQMLGDRDRMLDLLVSWRAKRSFETIYSYCEQPPLQSDLKKRDRVRSYLEQLELLGEDLYFLLVGTPERVINRDRVADLEQLVQHLDLRWVDNFLYHLDQSKWEVDHYVNPLMCFETLWLMSTGEVSHAGNRHG